MKRYIAIVLLFLCLGCVQEAPRSSDLIDYIPRKATVILKTHDLEKLIRETKNHPLLESYKTTQYAQKLNEYRDILSHFTATQESLIAFTQIGKDDFEISFISKQHPTLFEKDSTKMSLQKLNTTTPPITKVSTQESSFYTVSIDDIFMVSSSQLLLENCIREKESTFGQEKHFIKAYNASNDRAVGSLLIKGSEAGSLWSSVMPQAAQNKFANAFSWVQGDIDLSKNDLKLNGVVLVQDSTQQYLQLFKNTSPPVNKVTQITPLSAMGIASLSYDDWAVFKNNLADYKKIDASRFTVNKEDLLSSFTEISLISLEGGSAIAATTVDPERTGLALSSQQEQKTIFRQVPIYELEDDDLKNAFAKAYSAILPLPRVTYYCAIDEFYLFAQDQNSLETIIANYQNKATLAQSEAFQNTASQLSRASSLLFVSNTSKIPYENLVPEKEAKRLKAVSLDTYPFAALQLVQDNGFMHLQAIMNKNEKPLQEGIVTQIASAKLDEAIMMPPRLVKNHRTKGMDIVLQDQANQLYLLSNSGEILWKKQLDSPIVGDVQQVDLYRNGRLQLAFVTEKMFHILDRNGKEVAPFPLKYNDEITQSLAIFDYEKNRNYRFVITQTDQVTMYDKAAKKVSGFTFNKANDNIILPPQHLRINDKDYITIAENNGKLHILSRTGKSRIEVAERINFGNTQIYKEGANFVTYDVNGEKVNINNKGKVITTATEYGSGSEIVVSNQNRVALRENLLYINEKKVTLPYGSYSHPTMSTIKGKTYISCTDTESNQVYVFDSSGQSLDNFPIYGHAPASIGHLERNKSVGLVTQGDTRTVIIYRIN